MKKRFLSIIMALALCLTLLPTTVFAAPYGDTEGHWAEEAIERWSNYEIIQGNAKGDFDPNGQLTRGQLAVILARLLNLPEASSAGFADVDEDAWYADAINRCAAAGIMLGSNGNAMPDEPVTREQTVVMLARALGIEPIENPDLSAYTDADQIADYAIGYFAALVEAGIISGTTATTLAPTDVIDRASTVTILDRAISVYSNEDGATIDASDAEGGIILVVGANTTITNAPAGTVIIVAEGAEGLSVNGTAISDDQTYVVPESKPEPQPTTPSKPSGSSHSHSYSGEWTSDETHHWHAATCSHTDLVKDKAEHTFGEDNNALKCTVCGAYNTAYVAMIGDTGYTTLKDAVDYVHALTGDARTAGTTITLLKDASGAGIAAGYNTIGQDNQQRPITEGNSPVKITIDLNTHTYSLTNPGIGSSGSSTNGFQLLKGSDITFKNGKIDIAENSATVKILIMNYANLTLDGVTLDGTNLGAATSSGNYSLSNVCGVVTIKDSKIIAKEGGWGFDVDYKSNLYSEGTQITVTNSEITGNIEIPNKAQVENCPSKLTIESGTFNGNIVVKTGDNNQPNITIKGGSFTDLVNAVKYAANNATIKLLDNVTLTEAITVTKDLTLDMNGKTLSISYETANKAAESHGYAAIYVSSGELTITGNGIINGPTIKNTEDSGYNGDNVIKAQGSNAKVTVLNGTINAYGDNDIGGMYGISIKDGAHAVLGKDDDTGPVVNGFYAAVGANNLNATANVTIKGGEYSTTITPTIVGEEEGYFCAAVYAAASGKVTISGGTFKGYYGVSVPYQNADVTLTISGGRFETTSDAVYKGTANGGGQTGTPSISITGGSFTTNPASYLASGCTATENNGTWTVAPDSAE